MLYPWLDWHRAGLEAWLAAARLATAASPLDQALHPSRELFGRTLAAAAVTPRPVEDAVQRDAPFRVESEVLAATPFVRLVRLRRPTGSHRRIVLLAPHSGLRHGGGQPAAHRPPVAGRGRGHRLGRRPADPDRRRRLRAGRSGGDRHRGRDYLSSTGAPGGAVAVRAGSTRGCGAAGRELADARAFQPRLPRLPARAERGADRAAAGAGPLAARHAGGEPDLRGRRPTTRVPGGASIRRCSSCWPTAWRARASMPRCSRACCARSPPARRAPTTRQHGDLHSLLDVPGELFVDMLDWALDRSPWRGDGLVLAGAEHEMDALRATPVLTLEAGGDELVGRGQTHAPGRARCRRRGRSPYPTPAITTCSPAPAFSPAPHPSCAASTRDCPTRTAPASPARG